jgi:hypothetical protein
MKRLMCRLGFHKLHAYNENTIHICIRCSYCAEWGCKVSIHNNA